MPQTAIVGGRRRGGGLDLDGDDGAVSAFEDDVDLTAVPVAVVGLARGVVLPGDLPPKLHRSKGLEDHAGDRSILHETVRIGADQVTEQATVGDVGLRGLDDAAE